MGNLHPAETLVRSAAMTDRTMIVVVVVIGVLVFVMIVWFVSAMRVL
jgi:hypothetical protein